GSDVPAGATVFGVHIGGMSRDDAVAALARGSARTATSDLSATVAGKHLALDPVAAGLSLDAAATVDSVAGRTWNPVTLITRAGSDQVVTPVANVDEAKLAALTTSVAADVDDAAVEPRIVFSGTVPKVEAGSDGLRLDRAGAGDALVRAFLTRASVTLPVVTTSATVSTAQANDSLAGARLAVSAGIAVRAESITATLAPPVIASALTYRGVGGTLVPTLDGVRLRAAIAPALSPVETPGRDATWDVSSGTSVVVPSRVGSGVDPAQLASVVSGVLGRTGSARSVTAPIGTIDPALTTAQAKALGVTEKMSSFTQLFPYAAYRKQNIGRAATYINGTLLRPGDTFSMNRTIKERTPANGYTVGFVIGPGGVFKEDLGGGVSTATTTIWTAAFYAGLQRVFTQAHSIWISRYRAGLEATVAWGSFDMKFRNDTPHGVLITTVMRNTSLTVTMWGTKVYDKVTAVSGPRTDVRPFKTEYDTTPACHAQSGEPGFGIVVTRQFFRAGKLVRSEPITTRYQPSPHVECRPAPVPPPLTPPATPVPSPSKT
ncbi:MAG: VanW family protein, partial [Candidatus Nanopelagicales bacterium]